MKQKIVYCCEYCNSTYDCKADAVRHEAIHFGLTPVGYNDWEHLCKKVVEAGRTVSYTKNKHTDEEYDRAMQELRDFERQYGLAQTKRPSQFFW